MHLDRDVCSACLQAQESLSLKSCSRGGDLVFEFAAVPERSPPFSFDAHSDRIDHVSQTNRSIGDGKKAGSSDVAVIELSMNCLLGRLVLIDCLRTA